jgi:hypothetical protein
MRVVRVLFGALLGFLLLGILWFGAMLQPPEDLSRRAAIWAAGAAGDGGPAAAERIPCPVLTKLRFFVVCTDDCETIWRIVGVWGLQPQVLADLGRIPPEQPGVARRRINTAVAREGLNLKDAGAREMIGCYMRLDGLDPSLILPTGGRAGVASARGSDRAMLDLENRLKHPAALSRLEVNESEGEFETRFEYWDTSSPGWPVVGITVRVAGDGRLLAAERRVLDPADQ